MSYTALEKMRAYNKERFGKDVGPAQPELFGGRLERTDLKSAALRFIHERCEELKFDANVEKKEKENGKFQGASLKNNQIPYNMQMDINRLCLEKSLERFIDSGVAEDAYDVYYCYLEIFFGHYGKSKKMIELLSEFEANGSSLLMKHRDHFSHSVYVFTLGLAIYETNSNFRHKFQAFYGLKPDSGKLNEKKAANMYLEYWGLASLFHDIGYPFEIPYEQVMSYFEVDKQSRGKGGLYLAYHDLGVLTDLGDEAKKQFKKLYEKEYNSVVEVLAHGITEHLGDKYDLSEEKMVEVLNNKPSDPTEFFYYMDHAFFSACRLYRELEESVGIKQITKAHVDVLTAIVMHNSLFKFSISFYKDKKNHKAPLKMEDHPLAYMLMLCDELQCWDRTAYGRNSRKELQPMAVDFDFGGNAIHACYYYDALEQDKIDEFRKEYKRWEKEGGKGEAPRLKAYSDMAEKEQRFTSDIKKIVDTADIPLHIVPDTKENDRKNKHVFLSNSNFLHLYDFAVALNGRNSGQDITVEELENRFEELSLEYQLSALNRAKYFSRYLDAIKCFYTDKPVDYEMVTEFTHEQALVFAPMEHERWIREHQMMGWVYGDDYEFVQLPKKIVPDSPEAKVLRRTLREQMRCHKLAMEGPITSEDIQDHFFEMPEEDRLKDWQPFNVMLKLLKKFDGLRIYKLDI